VDSKGQRIAYANGKSVFLRSIDDPSVSTQYTQHTATTTVARFSPSGYYVASGDVSGMVRVWDCVGEGATKGEYHITRSINDLAWDGDSQRIIAVGDGKERFGHCITADSGNSVGEITGHSAQINTVAIKPQRPYRAVTGSDDTSLAFFHGPPFKFNTSIRGNHQRFIYGTAFSPDGTMLVSVGADKKIFMYDGKTGELTGQIGADEHKGSIFSVSWASDSKQFVTSSADQTVKIWDPATGKCTQTWRLGPDTVSIPHHQVGVVWARPDLIISLSLSGELNYLAPGTSEPTRIVSPPQRNITALTSTSSPPALWAGSADGRITSFSFKDSVPTTIDGAAHSNYISGLSASSDGNTVMSIGWDDTLRSIDTSAGTFTGDKTATDGQPRGVARAGSFTIVGTHKAIEVFGSDGQKASTTSTPFSATCVAATSSIVVVGSDDQAIRVYDVASSGKLTLSQELTGQTSQPSTLSFSPNCKLVAAGFSNGKIAVYDTSSWEVSISRWSAHTARVTGIDWRADGEFAASGGLDTSVWIWSVEKPGRRISKTAAHKEGVNGVQWIGDDKVASAGADGAIKIWKVEGL
jgi:WD40 repeat protein